MRNEDRKAMTVKVSPDCKAAFRRAAIREGLSGAGTLARQVLEGWYESVLKPEENNQEKKR